MDIRNFFKAAGKPGGAAPAPKKPRQEPKPSQEPAAPAPAAAQAAAADPAAAAEQLPPASGRASTPSKRSSQSAGTGSQGRSGRAAKAQEPAAAAAAGAAAAKGTRKRKKATVVDESDSDVEILHDDADDDSDFDAMSLDAENDGDDSPDDSSEALEDSDFEEAAKPKPAKRAKPSPPAAAAAAGAAGAKGSKAGAGKSTPAKAKSTPAKGRGKKAAGPVMVIEKNPTAATQGSGEKKRKLPGTMAGQTATQVATTPKSTAKGKKAAGPTAALSDEGKAAVALGEAAATQLPEVDKDSLTFAPTGMFGGVAPEDKPPANPGSKEVVRGHPDAFTGKTFVFSGVLDSLYRDAAKDLVLSHGGRITQDVSGKSSYLVVGEQCSRRKYHNALEKGVKVIDEDGLLALAAASASLVPQQQQQQGQPAAPSQPQAAAAAGPQSGQQQQQSQPQQQPQQQQQQQQQAAGGAPGSGGRAAAVPVMSSKAFYGGSGGAGPSRTGAAASGGAAAAAAAGAGAGAASGGASGGSVADTLWVEKYKPTSCRDLVGNSGHVGTLRQWLFQWEDVQLRGATPAQPKGTGGYQGKPKDMSKKAVLLAGPPGIGKTSSAHIVAKELGFQVVEVNASDARSKSDNKASTGIGGKLSNIVREMVTSTALSAASGVKRRQVLVMDEVDGMSAGDRGGVADLINTIKMSKIPIICICNDKYVQKLRSLRNHCLELDYRKPPAQQVAQRMAMVARAEGLTINDSTLRTLAEGAQGDLRLVLGQLQMARLRATSLSYDAAKAMTAMSKDADMSPFSACSKLLEGIRAGDTARPPSLTDQLEWVFSDADLVPLLVQENYVNYNPNITNNDPALRLRALTKASECMSAADVVNRSVRRYNNWGLMPFGAMMGAVIPATYMRGRREVFNEYEQNFTRFSAWFGNYSHGNKQQRLLAELSCAMAAGDTGATCSRSSVRLDYLPALKQVLTQPLVREGEAAIPGVISTMQSYCINREQFDFVLDVTKFKSKEEWAADPMKGVETKTKSAFTRTFNKTGLKAKTAAMVGDVSKGKGKGRGKAAAAAAAAGDDEDEGAEAVGGDAEGGAALAEEGAAGATQGGARGTSQEAAEEEDVTPEQLAARMRQDGISIELRATAGAASGGGAKGGRGGASGRGRGRGGGGGRSGGAAGRSGGRGRGRGK